MTDTDRTGTLHAGFSSPDATAQPWSLVLETLAEAEVFWISTVRPDGQPHVTPLIAVWRDGALYFCTGGDEVKARNLAANPECVLTTGCNRMGSGFDVVVQGRAVSVTDEARLAVVAGDYESKYGWVFRVEDGRFVGASGNVAEVFEVRPVTVYGYGRGAQYSATSWRFSS
ncbi:pyridoxamine 5'-phosphate oxidase family protein [Actinoalloteichus hymeniacidonis]|uniref:Pyridoxamine 5'-phosphate oxidase n=1 Tax=Actinoalloteichus hymeniacidonis TaxID=340345 RepID=A0AAC9MYM2_9PSEU|nr:pyridoxamine 5'-phosphate oxidase family protein [Actinoalloteichus hymeniacidonis]AOS63614.1 Pyridoxamine 5'-phosphate oxidase [Actinoalloteichus hymeniacidonis]MBB5908338.1 hypothetical protein [Actinoalloteichus hymeniacidonis]